MGKEMKVVAVESVNCGTLIQVDFVNESGKTDRMFIETRDVLRELNNEIYRQFEHQMIQMGAKKEPEDAPTHGLLSNA